MSQIDEALLKNLAVISVDKSLLTHFMPLIIFDTP